MRLIDADALKEKRFKMHSNFLGSVSVVAVKDIDQAPTIDAVEVTRCKDCEYWNKRYEAMGMCMKHNAIVTFTKPDFYCAWGERKQK